MNWSLKMAWPGWLISPTSPSAWANWPSLANPCGAPSSRAQNPAWKLPHTLARSYGATAFGTHAMILEIDPETMMIEIKRYVTVEDCGTVLNPLILEGQIHGGVSLGIGNAYYEKLHFDENGQLLNASFADYLIPSATEMPRIEVGHMETRSP